MSLRPSDFWHTPREAVTAEFLAQLPALPFTFAEPCCGEGHLIRHITDLSHGRCTMQSDLPVDARHITDFGDADMIITNPPFMSSTLVPMVCNFIRSGKPAWLLLSSDFAFRSRSGYMMPYCSMIVAIGQIRWIEGSASEGKKNFAWYKFVGRKCKTQFIHRIPGYRRDHVPADFLS